MRSRMIWVITAAFMFASSSANAGLIFSDYFDTSGGSVLNWDGGANWSVENGSVDLVRSGEYGISCQGGSGHCVDLDGSTRAAGELMSINLGPLDPGRYTFSYWLSGNQRVGHQMDVTFAVSLSNTDILSIATHVLFGNDGWHRYTQVFELEQVTNPVNLNFSHLFGDNIGILLDNVELRVSEPGVLALLGLGLLVAGRVRKRA